MPKDALRSSCRHAPRVDKCTLIRVQLLLELLDDNNRTREILLSSKPVEVFLIMGPKEIIRQDEVTIADWMGLLALDESCQPSLPGLQTKVLRELAKAPSENCRNAATRLVRVYHAQVVKGTHPWITERNCFWKVLDIADPQGLISAFMKVVAPASKDRLPLTSFKMTH